MTENVENGQSTETPADQSTETINETNDTPEADSETPEPAAGADDGGSEGSDDSNEQDDGELPIPEPDVAEDENKKKKQPPEWLKKKLERERLIAENIAREAEQLRIENARLKQVGQLPGHDQQQSHAAYDPTMPIRENYNNDTEYFFALADWRDNTRYQQQTILQQRREIEKREKEFQNNLKEAIESGKSKYSDFEDRTDYILYGDGFPSNRAMGEAIVESKYKDDILYFLGTHIKEAERIASLNPVQAAKEIAKIEVRFDSKRKSNITKAPKVIKTIGGSGTGGSATYGDPNKMGMDDFTKWYKDKFG